MPSTFHRGSTRAIAFEAHLSGQDDLIKTIDALKASAQRSVMQPAVRAGLKPILLTARRLAPKRTGLMRKWLISKAWVSKRSRIVHGAVGVRTGPTIVHPIYGKVNPDKYAHLVEYGHGGPNPAAAHPFLRPARDMNKGIAAAAIAAKARERLKIVAEKAAARARKKRRAS